MTPLAWHQREFERLLAAKPRLPHALLIRGPRGIGKLVFARALAQALLCEEPAASGDACCACRACAWFESGSHADYRQVEPESENTEAEEGARKSTAISVEQIRALPDFINLSSHRGGSKAIVIHPAEMLNVSAANALLKSLEEPPPHTHFLLVTHRPHQLLPTIRSRCQHIALSAPDAASATAWLAESGLDEPELALAHFGHAPLLALDMNETEYWGTRAAFMRQLTAAELDVLGAAAAVQDFPVPHVIAWLQKWSYDLVHFAAVGRVRYNPDYGSAIARVAARAERIALSRFHREMVLLQRVAHHPLSPRLFIEDVLLAYRDAVEPNTVCV